jgi:branched-chain amino acid transport system ATP-binding protein
LLGTIIGLVGATQGKIYYKSHEITAKPTAEIIKMGISYVPQGGNVFPKMTVRENLEMGGFPISDKDELRRKLSEISDIFPVLSEKMKQKAGLLSGGERQILSLGRALMLSPTLILLDEPSSGLDVGKQDLIFNKLSELNKKGLGILLVEQNVKQASRIAHYMYVLNAGSMKYQGDTSILNDQRALTTLFFGKK